MKFKIINPITSSRRHLIQLNKNNLIKKPVLKTLIKGKRNITGRNNSGKITIYHRGGGHKKKYRKIDFSRKDSSTAIVYTLEYDPNRNAYIASLFDITKKNFIYVLAPKNLKIGDIIQSGPNAEPKLGNSLPISEIPVGSYIYNISLKTTTKAQISRAAGTFSKLTEKRLEYAKIQVSSGKIKFISPQCYATIGIVSNELFFLSQLGKAGRSRWLNKRPTVRGVAMNPIDHPHGGGENKKSGKGRTPWGKPTKMGSTSRSKNKIFYKKNKK